MPASIPVTALAISMLTVAPAALDAQDSPRIAAAGTAEPVVIGSTYVLSSEILDQDRRITVGLPPGYERSDAPCPVLYVLDGEANFRTVAAAAGFLAGHGRIPGLLVVAVHNAGTREAEMTPPDMRLGTLDRPGHGDRFLEFFAEELIPHIDARYRTLPFRILHGHSHGAILGTWSIAARPGLFRWHLMLDMPPGRGGSFLERTLQRFFAGNPEHTGRLVSVEARFGWTASDWQQLVAAAPAGVRLDRFELPGESHQTMLYTGTYAGLRSLFHDYAVEETETKDLATLQAQFAAMSRAYGHPIAIPSRLLQDNIVDMIFQQRGPEAQELLEHLVATHGESAWTRTNRERIAAVLAAGPPAETVADILAYPPPAPDRMTPFLGTWEGVVHGSSTDVGMRVTFAVEDGRVTARTETRFRDRPWSGPEPAVTLRLLPDGTLEWGRMNTMRPFAVLMYSVRLRDDGSLAGTESMRGATPEFMLGRPVEGPGATVELRWRGT